MSDTTIATIIVVAMMLLSLGVETVATLVALAAGAFVLVYMYEPTMAQAWLKLLP